MGRSLYIAAAGVVPVGAIAGSHGAFADTGCTNQFNYAGDPRTNAVINSIGASTGQCPIPIPDAKGLPGLVSGAIAAGQPCYNYPTYIFGESASGPSFASSGGTWVLAIPVIGVRQIGAPCNESDGLAAQSPDGRGLVCSSTAGWVPGP